MPPNQQHRSVSFLAILSEVSAIPRDDAELKWYSPEENQRFRQELVSHVQRLSEFFATARDQDMTQDMIDQCIGVESFISQDAMRQSIARKRAHTRLIIQGQVTLSQESLSVASMESSADAAARAQVIASSINMTLEL